MSLTSTDTDHARIITVQVPRIDAAMAIQFKEDMRQKTQGSPDRVVLDLSQVDFIDSSGLGAIVASMKQLDAGVRLDLAGLSGNVSKVFRLTRMDTVFRLYDTLDAAVGTDAS
ncbi:STAS domain-containing protein [Aestuariivita sp.]|jgi:anti-sigma B factor antagonist|uniref:STAS domain-containing protein n=1 Tax=Aestuariivita sp. TaxID=1872407 RepID=UPI00216E60D0|nr:STAS domain-containing protein [Aestuariivita sp.]MCE8007212.1 STAS domain-containing protein [Aestuariivita sp.]